MVTFLRTVAEIVLFQEVLNTVLDIDKSMQVSVPKTIQLFLKSAGKQRVFML